MLQIALQKTVFYKTLLRIVGWCFLLYGLCIIVLALTAQSGDGAMIFTEPEYLRNYIFCGGLFLGSPLWPGIFPPFVLLTPGPLLWVSVGLLCMSATSTRVKVIYVCLQVALWLISLSVWFPIFALMNNTNYTLANFVPFWLVTLALSVALLACYKPVIHFLRKVFEPAGVMSVS